MNKAERKEYMKNYNRQYYYDNKERENKRAKEWRNDNKEHCKEHRKQNYKINKEKEIKAMKRWRENNYAKWEKYIREYQKQWQKNKLKTDYKYNINRRIAKAIWESLKGNKGNRPWEKLVGYTLINLIKRLKKTMPKGYTWQDYLEGKLHIDHIIPKSAFNFSKSEHIDFRRCWALGNLRLLLARENLRKRDKLYRPFQPALMLCRKDI